MEVVLTMKVLVLLLGLITAPLLSGKGVEGGIERVGTRIDCGIPSTQLTGVPATAVFSMEIRAYNGTGEQDLAGRGAFILGTRVLLTCDVTGLLQGGKVISYQWERTCTGSTHGRCEIQDKDPYYRVVNGTLLVDVTSWDQGGRYYCTVHYLDKGFEQASIGWTSINVAG